MAKRSGMKRIACLATLLLVFIGLSVSLWAMETYYPSDWQLDLEQYVTWNSIDLNGTLTVKEVVRARTPWNFARQMSRITWGNSGYFQVDKGYDQDARSGARPLPFPPIEIKCVLLEYEFYAIDKHSVQHEYHAVFVGEHQDMYVAEWIVHEAADEPFTLGFQKTLSLVGCEFHLKRQSSAEEKQARTVHDEV